MSTILGHAQTGIITYSVESKNENDHEMLRKIKTELELMEFTLRFDSETSHFKKEKNIVKDQLGSDLAITLVGATDDYYQLRNSKNSASNKTISSKVYQVDRSYRMTEWELTNETTLISNYTCYKAVLTEYNNRSETTFTTIAWYTPEIPVGYGPIGYGGLPGIILQLQYRKSVYNATHITLNPKKINVAKIENGEKVDYKEMIRLRRAARKVTED